MSTGQTNADIAQVLDRIAELLEYENANPFRVRAYREGAQSIRSAEDRVADYIHKNQTDKLDALPNVGTGITAVVSEYVTSGKSGLLEELESKASPEAVMAKVPGIGRELAGRIVDQLHIKTLPELEQAAHNGELASVEGFGKKRVEGIRASLAGILGQSERTNQRKRTQDTARQTNESDERPGVSLLLDIDADYRKAAEADKLQKIAPKRFNPDNEAWLPVLHAKRDGWEFTALFSNTAQAHKLEKTDDWVVIYYKRGDTERQHTVVTETKGPLKGKRVVRGRDAENRSFYKVGKS